MSLDLQTLLDDARTLDGEWNGARASRIRGMVLKTHSARARRTRAMGRVLVGGTSAACLVLALLRVAASAPSSSAASAASAASAVAAGHAGTSANESDFLASRALDDGGYTTD